MTKSISSFVWVGLLVACASANATGIGTLSLTPPSQIGSGTVSVQLVATDSPDIISGYDLLLGYDYTVLDLTNVTFGTQLGGPVDSSQGSFLIPDTPFYFLELIETSSLGDVALAGLQPGSSVTLATIEFNVIGPLPTGIFNLGGNVFGSSAALLPTFSVNDAIVEADVPEPGTLVLCGLAFAAVALSRKRRNPVANPNQ